MGPVNAILQWEHPFLSQEKLKVRMRTHIGQELDEHLLEVRQNFCNDFVTGIR